MEFLLIFIYVALFIVFIFCKKDDDDFDVESEEYSTFGEVNKDKLETRNYTSKRVYLHLSSGVDYIEFFYYDNDNKPVIEPQAEKCRICECSKDGRVLRESWGRPGDCSKYRRIRRFGGLV